MSGREGALSAPLRVVLVLLAALTAVCLFNTQAQAAPGAYRVLLAEVEGAGAKRLQAQVAAFPDVVKVDSVDTRESTPSAAELVAYDVVVSMGDIAYDREAWGNSLAEYVDRGGIVVQAAYDTWDGGSPTGSWETGGYAPLIPGPNVNEATTLGAFDPASPLMQGIAPGSLITDDFNTKNVPAAGATVVANWADERPAVAVKGRVVAITAAIGDIYDLPGEPAWTGNYGQLVVNAARTFAPSPVPVVNPSPVPVAATSPVVEFGFGKGFKRNKKKGTAKVPVVVAGGSGTIVLSGKKIKRRTRTVAAGTTRLTVAAKGKALKKLLKTGKVKVQMRLTFTPAGGTPASVVKSIQLKRKIG